MERLKALLGRVKGTVPVRVVQRYGEDDGGIWATVIAWNALTAIFPIVLFLIAIAGFVLSAAGMSTDTLVNAVVTIFPSDPKSQQEALKGIKGVQEKAGIFLLVGLAGYLWTASNLFGAMEMAFDAVLHCGRRPFVRQKLMAIGMMAIFSVLAVIGVATSVVLPLLSQIPGIPTPVLDLLNSPLQFAIGVAASFVLFFALYFVVPNRRQSLKHIWPGALLAGPVRRTVGSRRAREEDQGRQLHPDLDAWRNQPSRYLRPQARCAGECSRRVRHPCDQRPGRAFLRGGAAHGP